MCDVFFFLSCSCLPRVYSLLLLSLKVCTNVRRIFTDVNDWNAVIPKCDANRTSVWAMILEWERVRASECVYVFGVRNVKIRHSCNFPVVSCTINQADAWLRQEDGFCVVFILFCFLAVPYCAIHLSPHLTTRFCCGVFFFSSFRSRPPSAPFIDRVQDVERNIILKRNETKRN